MDESEHIDEERLIAFADDPAGVPDRLPLEAHLASCARCWSKLDDLRTMAVAMRDGETWWLAEEMTSGKGLQVLRDFAARLEAEDADAERLLEPFLESAYRFEYANIARRKRCHTGGAVRLLCKVSREQCPREPAFALALAETASFIADVLPNDYYPAAGVDELRGRAWKEYAIACQYLGRFDDGFDALNRAERAYRRLPDGGIQLATIDLCRAALLWEQGRCEDALRFARSASERFAERRETEHYFDAKEWEAIILHRLGDVDAALETLTTAFDLADTIGDGEMKARAAKNLGIAYRDRGDAGSASKFFSLALQLYRGLDQEAMVVKTRWSIARLALSVGNAIVAAQQLPLVIADFERLEMAANTARARLDLAEALLVMERFDEVHSICVDLLAFFERAKMLTGALTAAAYLREAAASRTITTAHIEHVRQYLIELERAPGLPFAPSPEIN